MSNEFKIQPADPNGPSTDYRPLVAPFIVAAETIRAMEKLNNSPQTPVVLPPIGPVKVGAKSPSTI